MINFSSQGASAIRRSSRGKVALILEGDGQTAVFKSLSQAQAAGLEPHALMLAGLCFMGFPAQVALVYENGSPADALAQAAALSRGGWICAPGIGQAELVSFVKEKRVQGTPVRAVASNATAPDSEGIVNFCADGLVIGYDGVETPVSAADYACRVAGILAGLSLARSATYLELPEVISFDESDDMDGDIDNGRLIVCSGGEGARLGRAVTSLVTVPVGTSSELRKIKIAEAVDMIKSDIRQTFEKDYIGKAINDYDSKLLLVTAINGYLAALAGDVLDKSYDNRAFVDYDAQRVWLQSNGVDVDGLSDTEILTANTDSSVFLGASIRFVDAMEDLTFGITM